MSLSNKTYSVSMLVLSVVSIFSMLFMLIIVPILPLDEDNILCSISQTPFLLFSGLFGLMFCGGLAVFTIFVMGKGKWKYCWTSAKSKVY